MIAAWIFYASVLGLVVTLAASIVERAARLLGRQVRFVWLAAMIVSVGWPVGILVARVGSPRPVTLPLTPSPVRESSITITPAVAKTTASVPAPVVASLPIGRSARDVMPNVDALGTPLVILWITVTLLLVARLARGIVLLRRAASSWRRAVVDGRDLLVTTDYGPAVVGLRDPQVVVPAWVIELGTDERQLVLAHEEEHRAARDPLALALAAALTALFPWNPALWLQSRRLRFAIELDCDARVLAPRPDVRRYGALLISIVERRLARSTSTDSLAAASSLVAAALTETSSDLERRIVAMIAIRPRHARPRAIALAVVGALMLTAAWRAPTPEVSRVVQQEPTYTAAQVDVRAALGMSSGGPAYPALLASAKVEGRVVATFVVAANGRVGAGSLRITESAHDLFSSSVRTFLDSAVFSPARRGGRTVRQVVELPFGFVIPAGRPLVVAEPPRGTLPAATIPPAAVIPARSSDSVAQPVRETANSLRMTNALYIVDGVPITNQASFDTLDIRSVEVIRGAEARRLYGSRADNGVVLITTSGKARADRRRDTTVTIIRDTVAPGYRSRKPLIVIDGVIVTDTIAIDRRFETLDIASIEVIRGAAAAALYGTRAADGVIAIKTKKR